VRRPARAASTPGQFEQVNDGDVDQQQRPAVSPTSAARQHVPPTTPAAGDTSSTAQLDSSRYVGLALSAGAVKAALGVDAAANQAQLDGRALWPNQRWAMASRHEQVVHLQAMLQGLYVGQRPLSAAERDVATRKLNDTQAAIAAQLDLHRMTKYNSDLQTALATRTAGSSPMAAESDALAVAVAGANLVFRQFYRPCRVRAAAESGRRRARLIDRTVEQSVAFINGGRRRSGPVDNGHELQDDNHGNADDDDGTFDDQVGHDGGQAAERTSFDAAAASTAESPGLQHNNGSASS
jgi:hypothetical protein